MYDTKKHKSYGGVTAALFTSEGTDRPTVVSIRIFPVNFFLNFRLHFIGREKNRKIQNPFLAVSACE